MLIEQIIEVQYIPGRTYTPITGYFRDKTKTSNENFQVDYYLLLKCCKRQCTLLSLPGSNQLKFNSKMQDVKRVLELNCK